MTPQSVLNACVRAFTALARVTRSVRITSTIPDLVFGVAVEVCPSTARAICSASSRSDLPSMCLATRLGRLTSTIRSPALLSARVKVAPNEPVLSTPIANTSPAAHPVQQRLVTPVGGRELLVTEQPALIVDGGRVVGVLVRVDAADHADSCWCC